MTESTWKKLKSLQKFHNLFLIALFLISTLSVAQGTYKLVKTIPQPARLISVDQLGNFYIVVKNNVIKFNRSGERINQYSNQRYGEISSIDATDPYKIVVFYEDFRIVVILDNQLSENGSPLDMQFSDFDQPILACRAYNTGIWTYDQLLNRLYRMTLSMEVTQSTGNLSQILGTKLQPNFMIEYNNNLYLSNPKTGILVFDQFGTYTKSIPIMDLDRFQVTEKAIFYSQDNEIKKFLFKKLEIEALPLPDVNAKAVSVDKNRLFIATDKDVKIYDFVE